MDSLDSLTKDNGEAFSLNEVLLLRGTNTAEGRSGGGSPVRNIGDYIDSEVDESGLKLDSRHLSCCVPRQPP